MPLTFTQEDFLVFFSDLSNYPALNFFNSLHGLMKKIGIRIIVRFRDTDTFMTKCTLSLGCIF